MARGRNAVVGAGVGLVVLFAVAGGALWWFVLRDDAPPPADVDALRTGGTVPSGVTGTDGPAGSWDVQPGDQVFVGYRIDELFAGETVEKTAVGRTGAVEGSLTIGEDGVLTDVSITADLTALASDQSRRDQAVRTRGLQTEVFPDASFVLTEPVALPPPVQGQEVRTTVVGELTLHGRTNPVSLEVAAVWDGPVISVQGSAPVVLADYEIERIEVPLVTVEEQGTFEVQLRFVPAG